MCIEILSKNIKYLRLTKGLTKKEMAKLLGIGVGSLSKLENGELPHRLMVEVLFVLEEEFDIPAHLFLCERMGENGSDRGDV